jgi:flavorubredoxin
MLTRLPETPAAAGSLPIAERCWMIGYRNPQSLLQCNTYLRIFPGARHGTSVCIDPGSQFDSAVIEANIKDLTGNSGLDFMTVNHQDPDVTGNLPAFCQSNPAATVMLTEDTWRLVQHLQVQPGALHFPPAFRSRVQTLRGGIAWQPVPTPFCHFRGAMAWYDPESQILFSGDLFGGLNQLGRVHLFAEAADWGGIAQFHQIYMPTREILRYAIRQIRALTPPVKIIAPQHGHVIAGDLVPLFLDQMEQLFVGYDLLSLELDELYAEQYGELVEMLIGNATAALGDQHVQSRLVAASIDDELDQYLTRIVGKWRVRRAPYACAAQVFQRLTRDKGPLFVSAMRDAVLKFCCERSIPVPPVGWGMEIGKNKPVTPHSALN